MSDTDIFMASYQNHRKAFGEANVVNKATVFDALAAVGITTIAVTFDGEGDSGQIENIVAYKSDVETPLPESRVKLKSIQWGDGRLSDDDLSLRDAVERLCYDFLEQEYDGWENNDGAFGEFSLDISRKTIDLEFNGRYTDVHTTTHSW